MMNRGSLSSGKRFWNGTAVFSATTVTSAPEALALMNGYDFDLVLSDHQMPVMDGITFLQAVRSRYRTSPPSSLREQKEKIIIQGYGKNNGLGLFQSRVILAITGIGIHERACQKKEQDSGYSCRTMDTGLPATSEKKSAGDRAVIADRDRLLVIFCGILTFFYRSDSILDILCHREAAFTLHAADSDLYPSLLVNRYLKFLHLHSNSFLFYFSRYTGAFTFTSVPVTRSRAERQRFRSVSMVNVHSNRGSPFRTGGVAGSRVGERSLA